MPSCGRASRERSSVWADPYPLNSRVRKCRLRRSPRRFHMRRVACRKYAPSVSETADYIGSARLLLVSDQPQDQLSVLKLVTRRLDAARIPYMITGSIASGHYGHPRMTRDIDIVVHMKPT